MVLFHTFFTFVLTMTKVSTLPLSPPSPFLLSPLPSPLFSLPLQGVLSHVVTLTSPEEFLDLLPPGGSLDFFLPFMEHSCKLFVSHQVVERLNTSITNSTSSWTSSMQPFQLSQFLSLFPTKRSCWSLFVMLYSLWREVSLCTNIPVWLVIFIRDLFAQFESHLRKTKLHEFSAPRVSKSHFNHRYYSPISRISNRPYALTGLHIYFLMYLNTPPMQNSATFLAKVTGPADSCRLDHHHFLALTHLEVLWVQCLDPGQQVQLSSLKKLCSIIVVWALLLNASSSGRENSLML